MSRRWCNHHHHPQGKEGRKGENRLLSQPHCVAGHRHSGLRPKDRTVQQLHHEWSLRWLHQLQEDHAFQRHYWLDASISFFRMMEIVIRKIKNYVEVLPISTEFYTFAENSSFKAKSHEKFNVQILGSLADVVVLCYPCMVAKRVDQL